MEANFRLFTAGQFSIVNLSRKCPSKCQLFFHEFLGVLLRCLQYRKKIDFFVSMSRNTQVYKNFPQYVWGEKWRPLFFCNSNTLLSPLTKNMKTSIFNMRHQGALVSQFLRVGLFFGTWKKIKSYLPKYLLYTNFHWAA